MMIGVGFVALMIGICIVEVKEKIKDLIKSLRWKYKYNHRFDDPPVAKCYCNDCMYYYKTHNRCCKHKDWVVADNWFCKGAKPIGQDPEV